MDGALIQVDGASSERGEAGEVDGVLRLHYGDAKRRGGYAGSKPCLRLGLEASESRDAVGGGGESDDDGEMMVM